MQSYTPIQNRFWSDGWVRELNALDRYLFLYLLTNGRAELTGIYELPIDLMAAECGIDQKDLRLSMLQRLEPKIYYKEGWVIIRNYPNHRVSDSPKLISGIRNDFMALPKHIQEIAKSVGYPIDTLSIPISVSRNRIEENRINNITGEPSVRVEKVSESDKEPKTKKDTSYLKVLRLFPQYVPSWDKIPTWISASKSLLEEQEWDDIVEAVKFSQKIRGKEFAPEIDHPHDLLTKWPKLEAYFKKHG